MSTVLIDTDELKSILKDLIKSIVQEAIREVLEKPYLTTAELSELLSISQKTLINWRSRKMIPFYRVGGRVLFKVEDVREFLQHRRVRSREEQHL